MTDEFPHRRRHAAGRTRRQPSLCARYRGRQPRAPRILRIVCEQARLCIQGFLYLGGRSDTASSAGGAGGGGGAGTSSSVAYEMRARPEGAAHVRGCGGAFVGIGLHANLHVVMFYI